MTPDERMHSFRLALWDDPAEAERMLASEPELLEASTEHMRETALHWSAIEDHRDQVRWLAERGADVNSRDQGNNTPLHSAAGVGHLEMVRLLLDMGADPRLANDRGDLPVHLAAQAGHDDVLEMLLATDPSLLAARGDDHNTLLHGAVAAGSRACVERLLELGANPSEPNEWGFTPLHELRHDDLDLVKRLHERGAELRAVNCMGWTLLHVAASHELPAVYDYLLEQGLDPSETTGDGRTAHDLREQAPRVRQAVEAQMAGFREQLGQMGVPTELLGQLFTPEEP